MSNRNITVTGMGNISRSPDTVEISFVIHGQDAEYDRAVAMATEKYNAIEKALLPLGFDKSDIKTSDYDISTQYESIHRNDEYKRIFVGYRCTQNIIVRMRLEAQRLSNVIGAVSGCVAEPELNVRFTVSDAEVLKDELIRSACANAKRSAEVIAEAMGVELGEIESINYVRHTIDVYSRTTYSREFVPAGMDLCSAAEFTPDDIELSDSAVFVWSIR